MTSSSSRDALHCPWCGGRVQLVTDAWVGVEYAPHGCLTRGQPLPWPLEARPFGACVACEFCIEVAR
jgi:hypothetical protein